MRELLAARCKNFTIVRYAGWNSADGFPPSSPQMAEACEVCSGGRRLVAAFCHKWVSICRNLAHRFGQCERTDRYRFHPPGSAGDSLSAIASGWRLTSRHGISQLPISCLTAFACFPLFPAYSGLGGSSSSRTLHHEHCWPPWQLDEVSPLNWLPILDPEPVALLNEAAAILQEYYSAFRDMRVAERRACVMRMPDAVRRSLAIEMFKGFYLARPLRHGFGLGPGARELWRSW